MKKESLDDLLKVQFTKKADGGIGYRHNRRQHDLTSKPAEVTKSSKEVNVTPKKMPFVNLTGTHYLLNRIQAHYGERSDPMFLILLTFLRFSEVTDFELTEFTNTGLTAWFEGHPIRLEFDHSLLTQEEWVVAEFGYTTTQDRIMEHSVMAALEIMSIIFTAQNRDGNRVSRAALRFIELKRILEEKFEVSYEIGMQF